MLAELASAVAVVWVVGGALAWIGLALVGVIWISTWLWQVPAHRRLEAGFDAAAHRRLTRTNWVRAAAWTVRSVIALALAAAFR
jgi:ABC-type bacteriocin/lantibiotic exporter with double-glycine peptidase domain